MTAVSKFSARLSDINLIKFVCKGCRSEQSFDPATWNNVVPHLCPNCPGGRNWQATGYRPLAESFGKSLVELIKQSGELPFEIRFDFDWPKPDQ
jgi:hypothetical protein